MAVVKRYGRQISLGLLIGAFAWIGWSLWGNSTVAAFNAYFGHYLPWLPGVSAEVISIGDCKHQGCNTNHYNQIDFVIEPNTTGEVVATKPGTVAFVKDSSHVGGCDIDLWRYANMVVVWHELGEYSWYVHLEPNSVPVYVGQKIDAGQVLGVVGMTGNTCQLHLHYMVSRDHWSWTDPNDPSQAPWATDIRPVNFDEVPWDHLYNSATYLSQNERKWGNQWQKARLWSDADFSGIVLWEGGAGFNNGPDGLGYAVELPDGWSAIVYAYDDRWGGGTCLRSSAPNLEWIGWQNAIRSIEVFDYNICGE